VEAEAAAGLAIGRWTGNIKAVLGLIATQLLDRSSMHRTLSGTLVHHRTNLLQRSTTRRTSTSTDMGTLLRSITMDMGTILRLITVTIKTSPPLGRPRINTKTRRHPGGVLNGRR
jgi:hypothetical protein